VPSVRRRLHRELGHGAIHAPVRAHRALPHVASRAPVTTLPQSPRAARSRRAELGQAVGRTRCAGRGRAGPGRATRAAQASHVGTVQLGRDGFGPSDS
jgi:hypothetical protein